MNNGNTQPASFLPDFCAPRLVFVVILVAELLAIILTLAQPPYISSRLFELAMYSLFIQWIALSCVAVLCLSRRYLEQLSDYWVATLSYGITLLVTLLITEISWWFLSNWPVDFGFSDFGHPLFLLRCMGISAIVCALALRYLYVQHQWRRRLESEANARFQALQSRIRPHFFFNCMNTIASLTRRQPAQAEEAIEDLADLFRVSLRDVRQASTLAEELALCERYLRIEKHRLGDRLKIEMQIDDLPKDAKLPSLSLQPLVENAIYHGIELLHEGGSIRISGEKLYDRMKITIDNPVPDNISSSNRHTGHHFAQENLAQRLTTFFGQPGLLQTSSISDRYSITLTIPYPYENTDR